MSRPVRALPGCLLVLVALACALATPADARTPAATGSPAGAPPKAWIIVDADSGAVIDASNPHASLPPASTVKLMTAVTALQTLPMSAPLTVSARAAGVPSRKINMQAGELWSVDNTVKSLLLVSANDAAYTLAENASGSLESFAATMKQTGKELGLRDSSFGDPAGLDNDQGFGFGDMMSAFDLAVVARNALSVPELAQSMTLQKFEFTGPGNIGHVIKNENLMLSMYPGATGMKTGFTDKAGRTLVASATRDGRTMIAVVLGYFDTYKFAQGLLDAGFRSTPNARGTGEKIPAPRVLTAQARADAWGNLPRALGRGDGGRTAGAGRDADGDPAGIAARFESRRREHAAASSVGERDQDSGDAHQRVRQRLALAAAADRGRPAGTRRALAAPPACGQASTQAPARSATRSCPGAPARHDPGARTADAAGARRGDPSAGQWSKRRTRTRTRVRAQLTTRCYAVTATSSCLHACTSRRRGSLENTSSMGSSMRSRFWIRRTTFSWL